MIATSTVGFFGQSKSGKSAIINGLLGVNILPVGDGNSGPGACTKVPIEIYCMKGTSGYFVQAGEDDKHRHHCATTEAAGACIRAVSESLPPAVYLMGDFSGLDPRVRVIDTPGNDPSKRVKDAADKCDVIVFVDAHCGRFQHMAKNIKRRGMRCEYAVCATESESTNLPAAKFMMKICAEAYLGDAGIDVPEMEAFCFRRLDSVEPDHVKEFDSFRTFVNGCVL